jgi:hypothetical protein
MVDTPRATSVSGVPYDGVTFPYVSGPTLRIDPRLQLHREWTDNIAPSTPRSSATAPERQRRARDDDPAHLGLAGRHIPAVLLPGLRRLDRE